MASSFLVGQIVRHTGKFLRNTGMTVGAPINGIVREVFPGEGKSFVGWPKVQWAGWGDEARLINPANIELDPRHRKENERIAAGSGFGRMVHGKCVCR